MPPAEQLLGVGLGLRWEFLDEVLEGPPLDIAFFEVSPENYMRRGGYYPAALERIVERYPLVTHGLTLSLGGTTPPPVDYLNELKTETRRLHTPFHSDHLSFGTFGERVFHELLPLKFSADTARRVADRLRQVEYQIGLPMAVENITWYAHPGAREMPESEFISEVLERSGCGLLLDVNNAWVNGQNHGFDPKAFIAALPLERVVEIHIAGHKQTSSGLILDTHSAPVIDPVSELLEWTLERTGPLPVLLERDNDIPELPVLLAEVNRLRAIYERALVRREARLARSA